MKRLMLCAAALVVLTWLGTMGAAVAANSQLVVTQDESSMERVIEAYLKDKHRLVINEKKINGDDLVLEIPMSGDPMPKYNIDIDTQSLNKKDDGTIIERGVRITLYTGIKVPDDKLETILPIVNGLNRDKVMSATYIDKDGEIILDWTLNVIAEGLATEYVYDVIARLNKLWKDLYPLVADELK